MRFNVATVQSAALNACNQVSVQADSQTHGGRRWSGGWLETLRWCQELGLRLEDADSCIYRAFILNVVFFFFFLLSLLLKKLLSSKSEMMMMFTLYSVLSRFLRGYFLSPALCRGNWPVLCVGRLTN